MGKKLTKQERKARAIREHKAKNVLMELTVDEATTLITERNMEWYKFYIAMAVMLIAAGIGSQYNTWAGIVPMTLIAIALIAWITKKRKTARNEAREMVN